MNRQELISFLEQKLGQSKYSAQGLKFCCQKKDCDTSQSKFNLEIHTEKNIFKCWACGYSGFITKLLYDYAENTSWRTNFKFEHIDKEEEIKLLPQLPLIISYHLSEKVKDYLILERQMDEDVLSERKISYCYSEEEPLFNHIIFPFYDERNSLIGFSSQNFDTKKYKNHRDLNFVAYQQFINEYYPIIICEGIYDCLSVPNAIPILGTKVSEATYRFAKDKNIILALDSEVKFDDKQAIANRFLFYGAKQVVIFDLMGHKDLNEFYVKNRKELKENLKSIYLNL